MQEALQLKEPRQQVSKEVYEFLQAQGQTVEMEAAYYWVPSTDTTLGQQKSVSNVTCIKRQSKTSDDDGDTKRRSPVISLRMASGWMNKFPLLTDGQQSAALACSEALEAVPHMTSRMLGKEVARLLGSKPDNGSYFVGELIKKTILEKI